MVETEGANLFDRMRPAYQKWAEPVSRVFARIVLEHTGLDPGARVLDVCAGTGSLALQAARIGLKVTAIDTAPVTTAHLAEQLLPYPGCTAEVMDALQMRWNKGQFDAAFSVLGVMFLGPHVPTVLADMRKAVRPGGVSCRRELGDATRGAAVRHLGSGESRSRRPRHRNTRGVVAWLLEPRGSPRSALDRRSR